MNCVLCNEVIPDKSLSGYPVDGRIVSGVYQCPHCRAVQGQCYLGDSYSIVKPYFGDVVDAEQKQVYFDLTCLGSAGVTRRHGWFDPASRFIIQVG